MTLLSKSLNNAPILTVEGQFLKSYIIKHEYEIPGITRDDFKDVLAKIIDFIGKPNGTYDINTGELISFDTGYQTTFVTFYDSYTDEEFDELVYKFAIMTDGIAYAGVYQDIPEISFHFEDYETAMAIAVAYNQISVWDWNTNDEIINKFFKEGKKN